MRSHVFIAEQVMDEATCLLVRTAMDAGIAEPGEVLEDQIALAEDVRRVSHIEVPAPVFAAIEACLDDQRATLAAFFDLPHVTREGVSLLRYHAGGFYRRHVDRAEVPSWPEAARRLITIILFLNDSGDAHPGGTFSGGLLRLYLDADGAPVEIAPRQGRLVAFLSDTPHEVTLVDGDGSRDTVVDWLTVPAE